MRLENPAQQRSLASIISGLSDDDRANIVRRLARLERLLEKQNDFDEQVAGALLRVLDAPRGLARPLAKQIRRHIREIAANVV